MSNEERLEEIKKELELAWSDISYVVNQDDVKWLINRVEESEESHLETKELLKSIVNQNKRYREALEFYADESIYSARNKERAEITLDYGEKARQALKGE